MRTKIVTAIIVALVVGTGAGMSPRFSAQASAPAAAARQTPGTHAALAAAEAQSRIGNHIAALKYRRQREGHIPATGSGEQSPYVTGTEQRNRLAAQSTVGGTWSSLGPAPIHDGSLTATGRVLALAYAPSSGAIYLGAADGGVWKSTNGGASWTPLTDSMPSLAIGALTVDPTNNNVIYAGTGEIAFALDALYGVGIYKSTDGGSTWTLYGGTVFHGQTISAIRVDPTSPNRVYAGVVNKAGSITRGVALSTDGGQTWTEPPSTALSAQDVTDLAIDNAGNLYAAVATVGVYVSTDHGATWNAMPTGLPTSNTNVYKIALAPNTASAPLGSQILYTVVENGTDSTLLGVYVSTNAGTTGATWTQIGSAASLQDTGNQAWYDIYVAVDPNDTTGNTIYVGLTDLYKTTNALGGNPSWTNISNVYGGLCGATPGNVHPDQHAILFVGGTTYFGNDGGIYSGTDSAITGSSCQNILQNPGFETGPPYTPWQEFAPPGDEIVNKANPHSGVNSADLCGTPLPCNESISQSVTVPSSYVNLSYSYYLYVQTQDSGGTCPGPDTFISEIHTPDNQNLAPVTASNCDAGGWYHVTQDLTSLLAPYKGQTVTLTFNGTGDSNGKTDFFVDDAGFNIISGASANFSSAIGNLALSQFYGGALGSGANASSLLLGGLQDNGNVLTTNSGATPWNEVVGGDGFYAAIDYNNNNDMYSEYVGGATSYSTDGGNTWTSSPPSSSDNAPFAAPLVMDPNNPAILYSGQGHLWKTTNRMASWTNIGPPSGTAGISAIAVSKSNPNTIYIGDSSANSYLTTDGGATWSSLDGSGCTPTNQSPYWCTAPGSGITGLTVDPTNSQIIYATVNSFEGAQQYHVFKSTNGGANWTDISTALPDLPFQSIAVNPVTHTTIYAGADASVYVSSDSGSTWSVLGTGLADASVYNLVPSADGTQLTAFTHGRGAWRVPTSTSGGGSSSTYTSVSTQQYFLGSSDGHTWMDMDPTNLKLSFTPTSNCSAVVSGNGDLWTNTAGVDQDLGINVAGGSYGSGQLVAWKESGGPATFSPNAAFVQTVIPLSAGTTYTMKLQWKANAANSGIIVTGAGGAAPFSPTRITAICSPSNTITSSVSTQQYFLGSSDGHTWMDMDPTNLRVSVTPTSNCSAIVSGNADLWTNTAHVDQDLGINVAGGSYGSGQLVAWKESGGPATFSPNAAFVQTVIPLSAGTTYTMKLQWKANAANNGIIVTGAGGGAPFSPTRITAICSPSNAITTAVSTQQYFLGSSDGHTWMDMDPSNLSLSLTPTSNCSAVVSGNGDLWTNTAGVDQDLGINVAGGSYGGGQLVAWKESGGPATFSPNAAFVQTVIPLSAGTTYTMKLQWKANAANSGIIVTGAGGGAPFSPTRITALCAG